MKDLYISSATVNGLALSETALFVDYIYLEIRVEKQPECTKSRDTCMSIPLVASDGYSSKIHLLMPQLLVAAL